VVDKEVTTTNAWRKQRLCTHNQLHGESNGCVYSKNNMCHTSPSLTRISVASKLCSRIDIIGSGQG
jgi:hypothetical protein